MESLIIFPASIPNTSIIFFENLMQEFEVRLKASD